MKKLYDTYSIYEFSDESIVKEICKRVKAIRLSCCFSQQEFADKAGVSIITIKRIESCKVNDITLSTLLKILRISGTLEGVVGLVPELLGACSNGKSPQQCPAHRALPARLP